MELSSKILSDLIVHAKYAKYLDNEKRRETWEELVERNMAMHIKKFPELEEEIRKNYELVFQRKVIPSARSLQFGGESIFRRPQRLYNCAALAINDFRAFGEIMVLLLQGCGVGYSIQQRHIEELPVIRGPLKRKRRFLIADSVEGWGDAVKMLMKSYFFGTSELVFDFSDIRPAGSKISSGGFAPGFQPLADCLHNITKILDQVTIGEKLSSLQVHEIICYIADAVLSGGIRRASCLALFNIDDMDMRTCKNGDWWYKKPHLGRANNSAVLIRHKVEKEDFFNLWNTIKDNGTGEPAFQFSNDSDYLLNPCCEASLKTSSNGAGQFCNLTEINVDSITSQEELNKFAKVASFLGTLQAAYTDFHYLRESWKRNTEKDALLGVGLTGLANNKIYQLNFKEAVRVVAQENERVAALIGINKAARLTVVKPSGTLSLVLGTSAGIHAWHSPYYIRRVRLNKAEVLYQYLVKKIPELVEDDKEKPHLGAVVSIPIKAPEGAIVRDNETAIDLLERIKYVYQNWIKPGHRHGANSHSISATVSLKPDDWDLAGEWLWENKEFYNCISFLPYDGGNYVQAPYEECTKEKYEELIQYLSQIDLSEVIEEDNKIDRSGEMACSGGACEITAL